MKNNMAKLVKKIGAYCRDSDVVRKKKGLEEELKFHEFAMSHIKCAVFLCDEDANLCYVNDSACKSLGYAKEELLSMNVDDIELYHSKIEWKKAWGIGVEGVELHHIRKDGTVFPVEASVKYIELDDKLYRLRLARDATEKKESNKTFHIINYALNSSSETILMMDANNNRLMYVNDTAVKMLGYTREELTGGMDLFDIDPDIYPDDLMRRIQEIKEKKTVTFETRQKAKDGTIYQVEVIANYFRYEEKDYVFALCKDISERKKNESMIQMLSSAMDASSESVFLISMDDFKFVYVNDMAAKMLDYTKEELTGGMGVFDIDPNFENFDMLIQALGEPSEQDIQTFETRHRTKDGRIYPVEIRATYNMKYNNKSYILSLVKDITDKKEVESQIEFLVRHDALTGLPNMLLAVERVEQAIAHAKRYDSKAALLFVDMDGFKTINDMLGYAIGDSILRVVAARLKANLREIDTIGRQGGDEFVIILTELAGADDAAIIADKLVSSFKKPFFVGSHILSSSVSIGVAIYPDDGDNFESLLQKADTAMYRAKERGKNTYCFFEKEMNSEWQKVSI